MKLNGSWRTSMFGAGGLATLWFNVIAMLSDGNPATNPDWSVVLSATFIGVGALFAKDAVVSNAAHPVEARPVDPPAAS